MDKLTPAEWKRVEEVFEEARARSPEHRVEYLTQLDRDEPQIAAEVRALLEVGENAGTFLEDSALAGIDPTAWPIGHDPMAGKVVGKYVLIERIARGGMGQVYLAERADGQYEQRVAIKLIRPELHGNDIFSRFHNERQVLANLSHPNIAQLFDGGTTDDGLPYLVMELVDGVRIDDYCDQHRLTIEQRLDLFRTICEAVHHAHQNLVIHRDLKPSNILVTKDSMIKLLDFGIARMLESDSDTASQNMRTVTVTGERRLTPAYASPEQIRREPITTASDVYSLGVVLYELLTGQRPYQLNSASEAEFERAICEQPPARPSTVVMKRTADSTHTSHIPDTAAESAPETIAANRSTDPGRLRRSIRGDLETIILTALAKEPTRRYNSVQQLSDDLSRFLRSEPILARPPGTFYQFRKFIERNALLASAAAAIVLALIAAIVGTSAGMMQARSATAEAERQIRIVEEVNRFLNEDLLAAADPEIAQDHDVSMRFLLDQAANRLDATAGLSGALGDEPLVAASIHSTLGQTYRSLGRYDAAERHLQWALDVYRLELGGDHPQTLRANDQLAVLRAKQGRFDEAERMNRDVLKASVRINGADHRDTLRFASHLAAVLIEQGRPDEAEDLLAFSYETSRRLHGPRDEATLTYMINIGYLHERQDRLADAQAMLSEAVELVIEVFGPRHPRTLGAQSNLAYVYDRQRRYDQSEPLHRAVLETKVQVLGEEHPSTLTSMNNLALAYSWMQRFDEAEPLFRQVLAASERSLGSDHPDTIDSINNLGFLYLQWGRPADALPLLEQAVALQRQVRGDEHRATIGVMHNLARVYMALERYHDADPLIADMVAATRAVAPQGHPAVGMGLAMHGRCLTMLGRFPDAERALLEAVDLLREALGLRHERSTAAIGLLADLYDAWHRAAPESGHDLSAAEWRTMLAGEDAPDPQ